MEPVVIFAILGCLFSGSVVYVVLDYHRHGERQNALENVLSVKARVVALQKTLLGYTRYVDLLADAKKAGMEKASSLTVKVAREQVYIETAAKDPLEATPGITCVLRYTAEYTFGFDLKAEHLDITATTAGIEVKVGRPMLLGAPKIRPLAFEVPNANLDAEDTAAVKQGLMERLPAHAQQLGQSMPSEASVRALCEKKLVEFLGEFLAAQPGVTQFPVIAVVYR